MSTMSFLTPPPEFDDCTDSTTMLGDANCLTDMFTHPSSKHAYSPYTPPSSSHEQSFMNGATAYKPMYDHSASLAFDSSTTSSQSFNMDVPMNMYEQPSWNSGFGISSQYPPLSAGSDESTFFPSYSSGTSIQSGMLPPTPQTIASQFNSYNTPVRMADSPYFIERSQFTPAPSTITSMSRSVSPNPHLHGRSRSRQDSIASASSPLSHYGIPVMAPGAPPNSAPQAWRCAYPNCTSRATFIRGCDLRKHYNRHSKHLFCRVDGCPQSEAAALAAARVADPRCSDPTQLILSGGFSSKKDRARHEAKHNPGIKCEWQSPDGEGCGRVFSRMDNMKDHVRRIHQKGSAKNESAADRAERLRKSRR